MSDERMGLTSASGFEVDALCPGRRQLIALLPPVEEGNEPPPDEFAERGTRIHRARELMDASELDAEDTEIFERGVETEKKIVEQWRQDFEITSYFEGPREVRMWVHWPHNAQRATSAKLDVHWISKAPIVRVLTIDWKALWAVWVTAAERNYQARVQAVCVAQEYDAEHVRAALNKAMLGTGDAVDYAGENIQRAEASIFQAIWETEQPGAQRRPGPWCNYCPCKPFCKEAASYSMLPSVMGPQPGALPSGMSKEEAAAIVNVMSPEDVAFVHRRSGAVNKVLDACKAHLKAMPDSELNRLGFTRKEGRKLDTITNTKEAFEFLKTFGISEVEIWSALKFSKTDLVTALQRDQGWGKAPAAGFVDGRLDPFITRKRAEDSIAAL